MHNIIIHLFPHELEQYKRIIDQINNSAVEDSAKITIESCLNMNEDILEFQSRNEYNMLLKTYEQINKTSKYKLNSLIESKDYFGVNEHRRNCIRKSKDSDILSFLDCDLYFNESLLSNLQLHSNNLILTNNMFIITPQIIKLWDNTWNILVNSKFINEDFKFHLNANINHITRNTYGDMSLVELNTFKWAGGWFTTISARLAKLIGIPNSFIGYGPDDTFMMHCCSYLKREKYKNLSQFIINGQVVCEDKSLSSRPTYFKKNLPNFRKNCNNAFHRELQVFKKSLDI